MTLDPGPVLLILAALILVPAALRLADDPATNPSRAVLAVAAVLLGAAFLFSPGLLPGLLAVPWLLTSAALAWNSRASGLDRILPRVYLTIGAAWAVAARAGFSPLGFESQIVQLTAIHFHYAGTLLPLLLIPARRELPGIVASLALYAALAGVPFVALGITATKLNQGATLELAASVFMAVAGCLAAAVYIRLAARFVHIRAASVLFIAASVALAFGMGLALLYGTRWLLARPVIDIPTMRVTHGILNSIGFSGCAILAWRAVRKSS